MKLKLCVCVCVQGTWLDDSVEDVSVVGYKVVSRLDRSKGHKSWFGGVLILARDDVNSIVEICKSETTKRMSCTIHTDLGPLLLVNWYRPPDDDATLSMPIFRSELVTLVENHVGTIVMGDLNIHHRKWLRFSNANTPSGRA